MVESSKSNLQQDNVTSQSKVLLLESVIEKFKQSTTKTIISQDWNPGNSKFIELAAKNGQISRDNEDIKEQVIRGLVPDRYKALQW